MTDPMLDTFAQLSAIAVPVLGRALLHFVWQGALIGMFAAIALHCARNARPQVRYALACVAMLACVLVPAASIVWQLSTPEPATTLVLVDAQAWRTDSPAAFAEPLVASAFALDAAMPWIVALWASGAFTLSLRMAMGLVWIQRLRAMPRHPQQAAWQARLDALVERFGEKRRVLLKLVDSLDSPVSAGWWRPVVVMPAALLSRMPADLIEALLAHELAHVRRHDYLVNLLQGVAEALLFYHPVTWWLSRRIRDEREHIADRLAAEVTGHPRRLALALCELSELTSASQRHTTPHLAQAAHGGPLMSRIEQLVRPGHRSARIGVALPLVGIAAACLAFYAHAQIGPDTKPASAAPAATVAPASRAAPAAAAGASAAPASRTVASARSSSRDERLTYALISKDRDGITMSGSTDDLPEIRAARRSMPGSDFVWFRRNGQAYVISDADTMTRIQDAWRESRAIGDRMKVLGDQMEVHGRKMEALSRQMEELSPAASDTSAIEATSRRMESLSEQQADLAAKQARLAADMARASDSERAEREASIDKLAEEQQRIGDLMEEQGRLMEQQSERMQANSAPMEALGRQMDEAGKPMDALGRQMDALGKEQKKIIDEAERRTQDIIDSAMARGLAQPLPRLTSR
ncbi:M56 family metallopeptidase [Lysobacter sp.]|uniref:M56 family metallopeptidase n=1 Tax=Lysobacter sp. TaxID=72226 RepID=UPI002D33DF69|nr:M56 family metallopeptidase [Lysobacter sp.]HZX77008.1 M56 family metallopeptidase [Lysobacter sp.]